MPTEVTSRHNLHSLYMSGHPLGVMCRHCRHRTTFSQDALGAHRGNMRELCTLRFVCKMCGSREIAVYLFNAQSEVDDFLYDEETRA